MSLRGRTREPSRARTQHERGVKATMYWFPAAVLRPKAPSADALTALADRAQTVCQCLHVTSARRRRHRLPRRALQRSCLHLSSVQICTASSPSCVEVSALLLERVHSLSASWQELGKTRNRGLTNAVASRSAPRTTNMDTASAIPQEAATMTGVHPSWEASGNGPRLARGKSGRPWKLVDTWLHAKDSQARAVAKHGCGLFSLKGRPDEKPSRQSCPRQRQLQHDMARPGWLPAGATYMSFCLQLRSKVQKHSSHLDLPVPNCPNERRIAVLRATRQKKSGREFHLAGEAARQWRAAHALHRVHSRTLLRHRWPVVRAMLATDRPLCPTPLANLMRKSRSAWVALDN